jgi:hypothetical protein
LLAVSLQELYTFWIFSLFTKPNSKLSQKVLRLGPTQKWVPINQASHHAPLLGCTSL